MLKSNFKKQTLYIIINSDNCNSIYFAFKLRLDTHLFCKSNKNQLTYLWTDKFSKRKTIFKIHLKCKKSFVLKVYCEIWQVEISYLFQSIFSSNIIVSYLEKYQVCLLNLNTSSEIFTHRRNPRLFTLRSSRYSSRWRDPVHSQVLYFFVQWLYLIMIFLI